MRPAIDQLPWAFVTRNLGQRFVGLVGIALREAPAESGKEVQRKRFSSTRGLAEPHDGRAGSAMAAIVGHGGPKTTARGAFQARLQHRSSSQTYRMGKGHQRFGS